MFEVNLDVLYSFGKVDGKIILEYNHRYSTPIVHLVNSILTDFSLKMYNFVTSFRYIFKVRDR